MYVHYTVVQENKETNTTNSCIVMKALSAAECLSSAAHKHTVYIYRPIKRNFLALSNLHGMDFAVHIVSWWCFK